MKKAIALLIVVAFALTFVACSSGSSDNTTAPNDKETSVQADTEKADSILPENNAETNSDTPAEDNTADGKTLVVYFSATGTTKGVAEQIAAVTDADTYEILAAQLYSDDDLDYNNNDSRATKEQNDKSIRPEIGSEKIDLSAYDTIYLGYPIWWGQAPRIMDTFVESYDFTGKTVIPFCTSGSSDIGTTGDDLGANAGSGNWLQGKRFAGGTSQADVEEWLATFQ